MILNFLNFSSIFSINIFLLISSISDYVLVQKKLKIMRLISFKDNFQLQRNLILHYDFSY